MPKFNYERHEIQRVLDSGPTDGGFYRLKVSGVKSSKTLNVAPEQIAIIRDLLSSATHVTTLHHDGFKHYFTCAAGDVAHTDNAFDTFAEAGKAAKAHRDAHNPGSVKLPTDVRQRLDRFKSDHPDLVLDSDEPTPGSVKSTATATCQHCGRTVTLVGSKWLDLNATGDDVIWRETCDTHDTFTAEHEPMPGTPDPAPNTWKYSQLNPGGADVTHGFTFTGTDAEWAEHLAELTRLGIEVFNAKITAPVTALGTEADIAPVKPTLDQVIGEATAMGLLDDDNEVATFNRLLDALDAVDTDEPDGEQRYQDAREACFAYVDAHPEVLPLAREYGLPISPGELPNEIVVAVDQAIDELLAEAKAELANLLADWLAQACTIISDVSGDMRNDWQAAIDKAKSRAETLGIEWNDDFIPDYVRDLLIPTEEV